MKPEQLKKIESYGLKMKQCNEHHWQIGSAEFFINYYPSTGTVYVNGMQKGMRLTLDEALDLARDANAVLPAARGAKRQQNTHHKDRIYRYNNQCALCKAFMHYEDASVDHIIPLSRGGSNRFDNLQLAHKWCNREKGNDVTVFRGNVFEERKYG